MNLEFYNFTIKPDGLAGAAAARYVRDVHEHLRWIHRTTSGRLLLNCIRRPTFPVEIRPHPTAVCNAEGGWERKAGATDPSGVVKYTPFAFSHAGSCATLPADQNRGRLWDEVLFHELVHVFRSVTGKWDKAPALSIAMRHYTDNEEFIAVMCTNIYMSDRTNRIKSGLRAGHNDYSAMAPEDAMRFGLFASSKAAFGLVKKFCEDHPIFSKALNDKLADVVYNPVADFYRFPKVCEALSHLGGLKDAAQKAKLKAELTTLGIPPAIAQRFVELL
jgi:hypothetical protein